MVQLPRNLLGSQGLELVRADESEPPALLEELGLVELVLEALDVGDEEPLVLLAPLVVDLHLLVLVEDEGLVHEVHLLVLLGVCYPLPDPVLVVVVADGLHQLGLELGLAHRVLVL